MSSMAAEETVRLLRNLGERIDLDDMLDVLLLLHHRLNALEAADGAKVPDALESAEET